MAEKLIDKLGKKAKSKVNRDTITRAKAIRLQCIECMGYQGKEVPHCTSDLCPLFPYRLGTNKALHGKRKNNLKLAHQKAFFGQNSGHIHQGNDKLQGNGNRAKNG